MPVHKHGKAAAALSAREAELRHARQARLARSKARLLKKFEDDGPQDGTPAAVRLRDGDRYGKMAAESMEASMVGGEGIPREQVPLKRTHCMPRLFISSPPHPLFNT